MKIWPGSQAPINSTTILHVNINMEPSLSASIAEREKNHAAATSVVAAIVLTGIKIVVGLLTGSLGILAEAAHSGLDLVAALVTYFAVRLSCRPADSEHLYGHGKIENLSALFETLLLLVTCVWIIYEAIERLVFRPVEIDPSFWAFAVMGVSIAIDASRSRVLFAAARKHNSQALEADALHFSTDIWSSSVVILGLVGVLLSQRFPKLRMLSTLDAVAALGVALIVIFVTVQMGKRTIQALLDTAPSGLSELVKRTVESLPGVKNCHNIRIRNSGPQMFLDVHVSLDGSISLNDAHSLTETIETAIGEVITNADVVVHPEPE